MPHAGTLSGLAVHIVMYKPFQRVCEGRRMEPARAAAPCRRPSPLRCAAARGVPGEPAEHIRCQLPRLTALIRLYEARRPGTDQQLVWNLTSAECREQGDDPTTRTSDGTTWDSEPCEKYLDDIVGSGPQTDFRFARGLGQGCFAAASRRSTCGGTTCAATSRPELGDLENLTYVDLSWNSIGGSIPTEIGRWNNIQMINLHNDSSCRPSLALNSMGPPTRAGAGSTTRAPSAPR